VAVGRARVLDDSAAVHVRNAWKEGAAKLIVDGDEEYAKFVMIPLKIGREK
jgi:hypothetical protein